YVIRSFNNDKPYSRFLLEQLAGDELADYRSAEEITPEIYDNLVATGFLRTAPDRTFANITNFVPDRLEIIADEIDILGSAVMGLTLKCARCHSHKFDPIPQRDYYRLAAILKDAYDEHDWLRSDGERTLPYVTSSERRAFEERTQRINLEVMALQENAKQASDVERPNLEMEIQQLEASRPREPRIRALWSRGNPSPTFILKRGDYQSPGRPVSPGVPAVLSVNTNPDEFSLFIPESKHSATSTGQLEADSPQPTYRRLALARWLTKPDHPLTARVMVNRIWMHHFGQGIVSTPGNFGIAGQPPTHPELLDWLATEFVNQAWSIKAMHRLMVTSNTYRQTSFASAESLKIDPEGTLYSRCKVRRLEAEPIRDGLLLIAGKLDETQFGPADEVELRADGLTTSKPTDLGWRRSIYILQRRTQIPTLLDSFDFPQMGPNCIQRNQSLVAPQALHMMNDAFVHRLAGHFAERMLEAGNSEPSSLVTSIYRHAFSRSPAEEEMVAGVDALEQLSSRWQAAHPDETEDVILKHALTTYCHAIINLAEFIYVE
ncbi:MAG: DUF1553 domain-containing protein, partial [Planctomycetaceae bacterium]|nr:DUF1553 domain-containing protein [Planctomycetaceae bacterium]